MLVRIDVVNMNQNRLESLIHRARNKEPDAFDAIIDHFGPRLFGYACRMVGSRVDAEDLLQELFLRVVKKIEGYQHEGQFEAWLFRIATNLVRDRIRRLQRKPTHVSIDDNHDDERSTTQRFALTDPSATAPSESSEHRELCDQLQNALEQIPVAEREVVMLRHFSQLTFAQIAAAMETPLGTALAREHRGLRKLRLLMETPR